MDLMTSQVVILCNRKMGNVLSGTGASGAHRGDGAVMDGS
jgi:hypothetical protein